MVVVVAVVATAVVGVSDGAGGGDGGAGSGGRWWAAVIENTSRKAQPENRAACHLSSVFFKYVRDMMELVL